MSTVNTENKEASLAMINRLFLRLAAIYGNTWRNLYKSDEFLTFTKQEWMNALSGIDESIVSQAIIACRAHHKFPPTIPEFVDCCRSVQKKNDYVCPAPIETKCDPKIAAYYMKKIKAILNMKSGEK